MTEPGRYHATELARIRAALDRLDAAGLLAALPVLHPVTGAAALCGPCALSALTGLPSDTWPDAPMTLHEVTGALSAAGYRPAAAHWAIGRELLAFSGVERSAEPMPDPTGAWALAIKADREVDDGHLVAAAVWRRRDGGWSGHLVDSRYRQPIALVNAARRFKGTRVIGALRLRPPKGGTA